MVVYEYKLKIAATSGDMIFTQEDKEVCEVVITKKSRVGQANIILNNNDELKDIDFNNFERIDFEYTELSYGIDSSNFINGINIDNLNAWFKLNNLNDSGDEGLTLTSKFTFFSYYAMKGNANDESINGRNGNVSGATLTTDKFDTADSAYEFDGSNTDNIECGYQDVGAEGTLGCWIKAGASQVVENIYPLTFRGYFGLLGPGGGTVSRIGCISHNGSGYSTYDWSGSATIDPYDGEWHFYSITWDDTNFYLYLDGIQQGNPKPHGGNYWTGSQRLYIGSWTPTYGGHTGKIAEVFYDSKRMNDTQMANLFRIQNEHKMADVFGMGLLSGKADFTGRNYLTVSHDAILSPTDISFGGFVTPEYFDSNMGLFSKHYQEWEMYMSGSGGALKFYKSNGSNGYEEDSILFNFQTSTRYWLWITFDSVTKEAKFYVDNILKGIKTMSYSELTSSSNYDFIIGGRSPNSELFYGSLEDFRMYGKVTSEEERNSIFNETLGNNWNKTRYIKKFIGDIVEDEPNFRNTQKSLLVKDLNYKFAERAYTGNHDGEDLGEIIYAIITEKFPEFDATKINQLTGLTLGEFSVSAKKVNDIFDDLKTEYDWDVFVNNSNEVILFENTNGATGIVLSSQNVDGERTKLRSSNLSNKNQVTVIGGDEIVSDFDVPQFTWKTGDTKAIFTQHKICSLEWVKFDSITMVEGTDFNIMPERNGITLLDTIGNNVTIDIRFCYRNPVWWREQDLAASDIREITIIDDGIQTQDRAEQLAKTVLQKSNLTKVKGNAFAIEVQKPFEWKQTLELSNISKYSGQHTIEGFTEYFQTRHIVDFDLTEVLDENTRMIVKILKDLNKVKGANVTSDLIKDGFNISEILATFEDIIAYEQGVGDRWIFDHPTNSQMDDEKKMRSEHEYSTSEIEWYIQ